MRRATFVMCVAVLAAVSPAAAGSLDVRLGAFFPQVRSTLFDDAGQLYGTRRSDWTGVTGGAEYSARLGRNVELGVHLDGYGRSLNTSYSGYTGDGGREIRQNLRLTTVPLGMTLRFTPTGRRARLAPYVGAGVDVIFWEYEAYGDFIDFFDDGLPVRYDDFVSSGATVGVHGVAGLRIPLDRDFSLTAEFRYLAAAKDDMEDDFRGNDIDVSGASATLGMNLRF